MNADEVLLVDLSSIAHPIWHMSQAEPDPNATSQKIVTRVRNLATAHPRAAICCDAGRSFRKDVSATYKANRPESDAKLQHQIRLACEQLEADGFPIWKIPTFEADDLVASAACCAISQGLTVLVVSADKDLLQLVDPCVKQKRPDTGEIIDEQGVFVKFGVKPSQIVDYLSLVGDASDNVKGAPGIGPKKAADLLQSYGTLDAVYIELAAHPSAFKPAMASALQEFKPRLAEVRELITLRMDAPVPFEEALRDRVAKDTQDFLADAGDDMLTEPVMDDSSSPAEPLHVVEPQTAAVAELVQDAPQAATTSEPAPQVLNGTVETALVHQPNYQLQLDPRNMSDARVLATDMFKSRLFESYGTPQGVLATVMLGRELGLPAMASLRQIHVIEGKQALSAQLMVALVLKSGMAEYFEPISFDDQKAVFETKRKGARNPVTLTHTIEMARTAGLVKDKSNWMKIPTDMLVARAQSRLCRLVYPDIVGGLYTPDELIDLREAMQAA